MSRNTKITKGIARELLAAGLPAASLDLVRELSAEGVREHTLRRALGLSLAQWNGLKKETPEGELSPLALAIEEGRAEGAGEVIAVMRARMNEGDTRAAEWLGDKLYKIGREDGAADGARVLIQINSALTAEEYGRVIHVRQD